MSQRFKVIFLEEAKEFLDNLEDKPREKIYYNLWKAAQKNDNELFKKLQDEIWEFRTLFNKSHYRLFSFWDKEDNTNTVVVSTHGIIKKTEKTPSKEIEKTEKIRTHYFNDKKKLK